MMANTRSDVWQFFKQVGEMSVFFKLCQTTLLYSSGTSMKSHLTAKHPAAASSGGDTVHSTTHHVAGVGVARQAGIYCCFDTN